MYLKDALGMLIKVLIGQATQFVEDPLNLHPTVGMWVGAAFGGDQKPLRPLSFVAYVLGVVMSISQNEARLFRQFLDQERSYLVVRYFGRGEAG
jgi:pyruvate/2-oxoglutarate/acetoin dehydrogenase E1 component